MSGTEELHLELKFDTVDVLTSVDKVLRERFCVYFEPQWFEAVLGSSPSELDEHEVLRFISDVVNAMLDMRRGSEAKGVVAWSEINYPAGFQEIIKVLRDEFGV